MGIPARQILTGGSCHLDARQVERALAEEDGRLSNLDILFIENVGNLICPTGYDLGEDFKIVLLSVTEGEDKPFKYPAIFARAAVTVVTKIDLLPYVAVRPRRRPGAGRDARARRPPRRGLRDDGRRDGRVALPPEGRAREEARGSSPGARGGEGRVVSARRPPRAPARVRGRRRADGGREPSPAARGSRRSSRRRRSCRCRRSRSRGARTVLVAGRPVELRRTERRRRRPLAPLLALRLHRRVA